ncbi:hypothetical protein BN7_1096 [Wickerhamomyces ciferrii]|uniref:Uncharacterized protein n=1 Tax=Wickerhamomyces ciferrii (strain ATCC 14091 / BCRC 22168 / CBS 111 / JCM 3599 / NBRC 0793 / NRRL Y-1031 F-60-10) TaxID=1206466 RepID=K0K9G7_WICCF|nr:uncharacterized protein BN7_1096 [Wickerhamomyces ciferrii]CCH41555.1 hypothetical protein BN7_1096 [Wickerhamomyces ciferrii]
MASQIFRICTHSGSFHADESLAVYMLRLLPRYQNSSLVRSRDPAQWEQADIVVDVGGKYDGTKFFDHHQRGFEETFNEKYATKLSSAGLVYKHFGKEIIGEVIQSKDESVLELLYDKIYKEFIESLDANDNGVSKYDNLTEKAKFNDRNITLPSLVSNLNPHWNAEQSDEDFDRQFLIASELMGNAFVNVVKNYGLSWLPAKKIVEDSFNQRFEVDKSGKILVLSQFAPWKEHLYEIEKSNDKEGEILYVLFEDSGKNWRISTVPITSASFDNRKPLPENWRGLRDDALSKESGVEGCVFVHAAGFIGGAKTKDAVLQLARLSL